MTDFIKNCPKVVLERIWQRLAAPDKEIFCNVYPEMKESFAPIGNEYHCPLCLFRIFIEMFAADDGALIPKTFGYKPGLNIVFTNEYFLKTWQLRNFSDPVDAMEPTAIFAYFLTQLDRSFSFENENEIKEHLKTFHEQKLMWDPADDFKRTNFINNRIEFFVEDDAQAKFKNFFLGRIGFLSENRINWDPVIADNLPIGSYRAIKTFSHFLEKLEEDHHDEIGGKTS